MRARRFPIAATLLVLIAVGIMVRLGFWQLDRRDEKEALIARYSSARHLSADVPFPRDERTAEKSLYRHSRLDCRGVAALTAKAGSNARGESGLAHYASCVLADGGRADVVLGWSRDPHGPDWRGGVVAGVIAPGPRLVADPPLAGLQANQLPDPSEIPNNHLAYAVQWFLFALTALVIFALAVRRLLRG